MKSCAKTQIKKNKILPFLSLVLLGVSANCVHASTRIPPYSVEDYAQQFNTVLKKRVLPAHNLSERITNASAFFLGSTYVAGALGEGSSACYDKSPLYRTDAFDCLTYVSTVLALVKSNTLAEFIANMVVIQYSKNKVSYFNRHHFMEVDWNVANEKNHFIVDITANVYPHGKIAVAVIDKPSWYRHLSPGTIKTFAPSKAKFDQALLQRLHHHAAKVKPCLAYTRYIPFCSIMTCVAAQWVPDSTLLDRIPSGAIIEFIDKSQHAKTKIGTDVNIVHVGFIIRSKQGLFLRHASEVHGQVMDVPLAQYLQRYYGLTPDPVGAGIRLYQITPGINRGKI